MAQQTQINGNRFSFVNISLNCNGLSAQNQQLGGTQDQPRGCLQSINYNATLEPGMVQGNQIAPVGRTSGYGLGEGDVEILVSEYDQFVAFITNNGQYPIMQVDFNYVVSYSINDIDVRKDELIGCRITNLGSNNQVGNNATTKTMKLSIMRQRHNGVEVYADPTVA